MIYSRGLPPSRVVWRTTTAAPPSRAAKSRRPFGSSCPASWPSMRCRKARKPSPNTPVPSKRPGVLWRSGKQRPVRTYVRTYIHTYIHTCMYVCMYVCMHVCMYIHTYIHTYVHTYIRTYVHTYTRTYVCTYVCIITFTFHIFIKSKKQQQNKTQETEQRNNVEHKEITLKDKKQEKSNTFR